MFPRAVLCGSRQLVTACHSFTSVFVSTSDCRRGSSLCGWRLAAVLSVCNLSVNSCVYTSFSLGLHKLTILGENNKQITLSSVPSQLVNRPSVLRGTVSFLVVFAYWKAADCCLPRFCWERSLLSLWTCEEYFAHTIFFLQQQVLSVFFFFYLFCLLPITAVLINQLLCLYIQDSTWYIFLFSYFFCSFDMFFCSTAFSWLRLSVEQMSGQQWKCLLYVFF